MGQVNYAPEIEVHKNYVPHVPYFVVQVWYKIGDLRLETKSRREGYRAYSELCTTNCGTFKLCATKCGTKKLCATRATNCGTSVAQNRGSGVQNQKLPLNISKLEYYGTF